MLQLFQFYPAFGVRNLSPFCLKLETYLRMSGIEHEVVWSSSTRGAPKGKLPYIVNADVTVGDSELIIDHLIEKFGDRLDGKLSASQQALSVAWRRLFEDSLMFPILHSRWVDPAGWKQMQHLFDALPPPKRETIANLQRDAVRTRIKAQGTGDHSQDEIYHFGLRYLSAIETQLGDSPFMLGDTPCSLDATAYGFLANLVDTDFDNPLNRRARDVPPFVAYCKRMKALYFADLDA